MHETQAPTMPSTNPSNPRPAPPITGVAHATLPASDLERAERFYVDLLGLTLVRHFDRATFLKYRPERAAEAEADADNSPLHLELRCGDLQLDIFLQRDHRPAPPRPHPHIAFEVAPHELDPFRERLSAAGVPTEGPRRLGPPGHASLYFLDPFGNLLELVTMGYEGPVHPGPPELAALSQAPS